MFNRLLRDSSRYIGLIKSNILNDTLNIFSNLCELIIVVAQKQSFRYAILHHNLIVSFQPNCRGLGQERKRRDLEYAGEDFNSELPPSLNRVLTMGPLMVAVNDVLIDPSRHGGLNAPEGKILSFQFFIVALFNNTFLTSWPKQ